MMNLFVMNVEVFLEVTWDSRGKCSILLRRRESSRALRDARMGHSLGSGCLSWEIFSPFMCSSTRAIGIVRSQLRFSAARISMTMEWCAVVVLEMLCLERLIPLLGRLNQ